MAHRDDAVIRPCVCATRSRVDDVGLDQLPRLQGGIGHPERPADHRVDCRFARQQPCHRDVVARHAGGDAGLGKPFDVVVRVFGGGDEVAACVLDAGRCDPAQNDVLGDALAGRGGVLDDVSTTGMEQAVVAAARPAAEIALLDDERTQASPGEIPNETGAGRSATDDEDVDGEGSRCHRRVAIGQGLAA